MTLPRKRLVSSETANWYHIISKCVRGAFLCDEQFELRKEMIRQRVMHVAQLFCVEVASYALMDNHMHIIMLLDPTGPEKLSDEDVARRWLQAFPRNWDWTDKDACPEVDELRLNKALQKPQKIAEWRGRLGNLGWCMKALKEPVARRCNREDGCSGAFWQSRYKSIVLLDQAALISAMAYTDLNPIRACMAETPEQSDYTSIQDRIDQRQIYEKEIGLRQRLRKNKHPRPNTANATSTTNTEENKKATAITGPESNLWLSPIKTCVAGDWQSRDNGMSPEDYFTLVEETGRIIRSGKCGSINSKLAPILQRLNLDVEAWIDCMRSPGQMLGAAIGHITARIAEASRRGVKWVRNRCALFATDSPQ